jgi:hypothetical protein
VISTMKRTISFVPHESDVSVHTYLITLPVASFLFTVASAYI